MERNAMRPLVATLALGLSGLLLAADPVTPATVAKPSVEAHAKPDFASPAVATFKQNAAVSVTGQQGLWFKLALDGGKTGYVRVNEVRVAYGSTETGGIGKALFTGKAGKGRVSETASVRGIDESSLKAARYDADGQLQNGSYMDYAMPRAKDLPSFVVDHSSVTPCTHNPLGVKGCGEAGAIGSPPALVNAVLDALHSGGFKVEHIDMPLTPARVWAAMAAAK